MKPTRIRMLLAIAGVAAVFGWVLATLVDRVLGRLLPIPSAAAAALALMAGFLLIWGLLARPRLQRLPGRVPLAPLVAARTAALGMAASRTGALLMGGYAGIAVAMVPSLQTAAGRSYALVALLASAASLGLAVVGLWVEHICRLRDDDRGDRPLPAPT